MPNHYFIVLYTRPNLPILFEYSISNTQLCQKIFLAHKCVVTGCLLIILPSVNSVLAVSSLCQHPFLNNYWNMNQLWQHSGAVINMVTIQQERSGFESEPDWGLSVLCAHVLPVPGWVLSQCSGFRLQPKDTQIRSTGYFKLPWDVKGVPGSTLPFSQN